MKNTLGKHKTAKGRKGREEISLLSLAQSAISQNLEEMKDSNGSK